MKNKLRMILFACLIMFFGIVGINFTPFSAVSADAIESNSGGITVTMSTDKTDIKTNAVGAQVRVTVEVNNATGKSMFGGQVVINIDTNIFEFVSLIKSTDISNTYEDSSTTNKAQGKVGIAGDNNWQPITKSKWLLGGYILQVKVGASISAGTTGAISMSGVEVADMDGDIPSTTVQGENISVNFSSPSNACEMTNLTCSGLTITKSGENFTATVPYSTKTINTASLRPTVSAGATVTYSPSGNVALTEGQKTINMVVTAEDNTTKKTFQLIITRTAGETIGTLSSLQVLNGTTPVLSKTNADLASGGTFTLGNISFADKDKLSVVAAKNGSFSTMQILVDGQSKHNGGDASKTLAVGALSAGAHNIKVVVTPQKEGAAKTEYTINFNVDSPQNDKTLSSLVLKTTDGKEIRFTDEFSPNTTKYSASVPQGTTHVVVEATANGSLATVTGAGQHTVPGTIQVVVTAQDGSSTTYEIVVNEFIDVSGLKLVNPTVWAVDSENNEYLLTMETVLEDVFYTVRIPHNYVISCYKIVASSSDPSYTLEGVNATFDITKGQTVPHRLNFRKNGHAEKVIIVEITYETNIKTLNQIIYGNDVIEVTDATDYAISVNKDTETLRVTAVPTQPNAKVTIVFSDAEIVFSDAEKVINLQSGRNIVLIKVQALNGDTEIYTLTIDKEIVFNNLPYIIVIAVLGADLAITILVFSIIVTKLKRKLKGKIIK